MSRTHLELLEIADQLRAGDTTEFDQLTDAERTTVACAALDIAEVELVAEKASFATACIEISDLRAQLAVARKRK